MGCPRVYSPAWNQVYFSPAGNNTHPVPRAPQHSPGRVVASRLQGRLGSRQWLEALPRKARRAKGTPGFRAATPCYQCQRAGGSRARLHFPQVASRKDRPILKGLGVLLALWGCGRDICFCRENIAVPVVSPFPLGLREVIETVSRPGTMRELWFRAAGQSGSVSECHGDTPKAAGAIGRLFTNQGSESRQLAPVTHPR